MASETNNPLHIDAESRRNTNAVQRSMSLAARTPTTSLEWSDAARKASTAAKEETSIVAGKDNPKSLNKLNAAEAKLGEAHKGGNAIAIGAAHHAVAMEHAALADKHESRADRDGMGAADHSAAADAHEEAYEAHNKAATVNGHKTKGDVKLAHANQYTAGSGGKQNNDAADGGHYHKESDAADKASEKAELLEQRASDEGRGSA